MPHKINLQNQGTLQIPGVDSQYNPLTELSPMTTQLGINPQPIADDSFFNSKNLSTLGTGLSAAGSLGQLWMGLKNYGLMKDQLKENKFQYGQNYAAQKKITNSNLQDRQTARVASGDGYQSVGAYMSQNGVA